MYGLRLKITFFLLGNKVLEEVMKPSMALCYTVVSVKRNKAFNDSVSYNYIVGWLFVLKVSEVLPR